VSFSVLRNFRHCHFSGGLIGISLVAYWFDWLQMFGLVSTWLLIIGSSIYWRNLADNGTFGRVFRSDRLPCRAPIHVICLRILDFWLDCIPFCMPCNVSLQHPHTTDRCISHSHLSSLTFLLPKCIRLEYAKSRSKKTYSETTSSTYPSDPSSPSSG